MKTLYDFDTKSILRHLGEIRDEMKKFEGVGIRMSTLWRLEEVQTRLLEIAVADVAVGPISDCVEAIMPAPVQPPDPMFAEVLPAPVPAPVPAREDIEMLF